MLDLVRKETQQYIFNMKVMAVPWKHLQNEYTSEEVNRIGMHANHRMELGST
jgi:hypothetical protein